MDIRICEFNPEHTTPLNAAEVHDSCRVYLWAHELKLTKLHDMMAELCQFSPSDILGDHNEVPENPQSVKRQIETLSLKIMCSKVFGKAVSITHTPEGKPMLCGCFTNNIHISVTHTSGYYALSVASRPHGIDIEHKSERALRLLDKFLTPNEKSIHLPQFIKPEDNATALWCAKEAAFKTFSSPAITLINQLHLILEDNQQLTARPIGQKETKARLNFFQIDDCILAVSL